MEKLTSNKNFEIFRNFEIDKSTSEDEKSFLYTLKFASREPFERWFGMEVIDVKNMDLSRLNNNAPVLFNHDKNKIIGVVEKAYIKDEIAYCDIRLSKTNEDSLKIKQLIDENIISKVSFGYSCLETKFIKEENNLDFYEFKVQAFEVSIVTIPADDTVGIVKNEEFKRELEVLKKDFLYNKDIIFKKKEKQMTIENSLNVEKQDHLREILELGKMTNNVDLALKFIDEERSLEDFKKEILRNKKTEVKKVDNVESSNEVRSLKNLGQIIKENLENQRGFTLRNDAYREYNGFKVEGKGKELHTTTFADIVSNIKNEHILSNIGFDIRENIVGDLIVPVFQEAPVGTVQTEQDTIIDGKAFTTAQFRIEKETFTLSLKHSYELLKQSADYIQQFIIEEGLKSFYTQVGQKLIKKFLDDVTIAHEITDLSYADIVSIQDKVWIENEGKFFLSKKLLSKLKTVTKFEHTATPIFDGQSIDGEDYVVNKLKPADQTKEFVCYGDLSKFVVALFGSPDIYIDPIPDDKNQFTIKFVGMYGGKLTNPASVCKSEVQLN